MTAVTDRGAAEMIPIEHKTLGRVVRTLVFAVPPAALVLGGWLAWGGVLHWSDLLITALTYVATGLGITVGYHRLFTHRSFKTTRTVRVLLAVLGSMAVEGPVIEWVATHRKHHRFTDAPGDPHSPHLDGTPGWRDALRGLTHAHVGWMLRGQDMANPSRYAKDLRGDQDLQFISRTFPLWVLAGLALPFGLGVALTGSLAGGLTGLLWHNNHHAFPTSARHGPGRGQLDPGGWLITRLERAQLAWDVVQISPSRQQTKHGGAGRQPATSPVTSPQQPQPTLPDLGGPHV